MACYIINKVSLYFCIDKQLITIIVDLFIAGAETTSNSIGLEFIFKIHIYKTRQHISIWQVSLCFICCIIRTLNGKCRTKWTPFAVIHCPTCPSKSGTYENYYLLQMGSNLMLWIVTKQFAIHGSGADGGAADQRHPSAGCNPKGFARHTSPGL